MSSKHSGDEEEGKSVDLSAVNAKSKMVDSKVPTPISILNYDLKNPKPIDSPRSLKAMEVLIIDQAMLIPKSRQFFKTTAINGADLDKLMMKDLRGVGCYIKQIKEKRSEMIKKEKREKEWHDKEQKEKEKNLKKLKHQSERADKIKHEIEEKVAEEIEKKIEDRYKKLREGEEQSPYFDQYTNLNYVPKPKEYFKLNAQNQSIKYQFDLSKNKVSIMKEKQLKEMGHMMDYEINLQHIKERNEGLHRQKVKTLKSMENFKKQRFEKNMDLLKEQERRLKQQKFIDDSIKKENKQRMMMINERESAIRLQKLKEIEQKAITIKKSEYDYDQNRRYMVKQLVGDFKELKHGHVSIEDIKRQYAYLRDEEAFEKAMNELNKRRHMSRLIFKKKMKNQSMKTAQANSQLLSIQDMACQLRLTT